MPISTVRNSGSQTQTQTDKDVAHSMRQTGVESSKEFHNTITRCGETIKIKTRGGRAK